MIWVGVRAHCCFVHEGDFIRIALTMLLWGWRLNPNLEVASFVSILPPNVKSSYKSSCLLDPARDGFRMWLMEGDVAYFLWRVVKHWVLNWRASNIKTLDVKYVPMIIIYKEEKTMKLLKDWNVGLGVTSTLLKIKWVLHFCCYSFKNLLLFFFFFLFFFLCLKSQNPCLEIMRKQQRKRKIKIKDWNFKLRNNIKLVNQMGFLE